MQLMPEAMYVVITDDQSIACRHPDGKEEGIGWDDLKAVIIETNDSGPFGTDIYWILVGDRDGVGCVVPGGASGEAEMLERLQRLPNFDNGAVIEAMASVENATFLCWKKEGNDE